MEEVRLVQNECARLRVQGPRRLAATTWFGPSRAHLIGFEPRPRRGYAISGGGSCRD